MSKDEGIFGFDGEGPFTQKELAEEAARLKNGLAPHDRPGSAHEAEEERKFRERIARIHYGDDGLPQK